MRLSTVLSAPRLISALLFALTPSLATAGGAFLMKGGVMRLSDDTQTLSLGRVTLDDTSDSSLAINVEGRTKNGMAFGAEYLIYRNDLNSSITQTGEAKTQTLQFLAKKYFIDGGVVHPYLGVGVGVGRTNVTYSTTVSSFTTDNDFTLAIQALVGLELRFDNLSFQAEVKHLYHDVNNNGNEYDPTATGLFVSLGFNW